MAFKDTLMKALHSAVENYNAGGSVDDAVVKAAQDNDFNIDQTTRLVEMFNTARTLYHYKAAADRTTSCDLADGAVVVSRLFAPKAKEKTASVRIGGYSEYDAREVDYFAPNEKTAANVTSESGSELTGLSFEALSGIAMRELRDMRQTAKIASDEARICGANAARSLEKLARLFAYGDDASRSANADRYARLEAAHGSGEFGPVLAKLAEFVPASNRPSKAAIEKRAASLVDDSDLKPHVALMKEARGWMQAEAELQVASGQISKTADNFEHEYFACLGEEAPTTKQAGLSEFVLPTSAWSKSAAPGGPGGQPEKPKSPSSAPGVIGGLASMVGDAGKKGLVSTMDTDVSRALAAPYERENKDISEGLKNVQRQLMLQDLMTNDPVLSEEAPESIAQAYSAVMRMAPEVSTNKEVVRAILRQSINSVAVSPYDAEMWTKLEKNLANIRGGNPAYEDKNV